MMLLAVLTVISGIGLFIQMIVWMIDTWKQATEEERRYRRFVKFSKIMEQTNLKLGE